MRRTFQRICVFCGSSAGNRPAFRLAATELGRHLAIAGVELVYGGGHVGLMGVIADAALGAGGRVTGVIPRMLATRELAHTGLTALEVVPNMHDRKARMAELAEAFIAMPGGFGTFEELFEVITWAQLGIHAKPIGLLNVDGCFDPLIQLIDRAVRDGFIQDVHRHLVVVSTDAAQLLDALEKHEPPVVRKWADPQEI